MNYSPPTKLAVNVEINTYINIFGKKTVKKI